ncbi:unnamed protein product, partial [Didymodactylos carnosus]
MMQQQPMMMQQQPQQQMMGGQQQIPFMPQQRQFSTQSAMGGFPRTNNSQGQTFENDVILSNLTGWSLNEVERLRHEFMMYANQHGVIDRESFRKLYVASLLNMNWETLEHDAEAAFRNFDVNLTGALDF